MDDAINKLPPEIFIWGAVGQTKLIRPVIEHSGSKLVAIFDERMELSSPYDDIPLYYGWDAFLRWVAGKDKSGLGFCLSVNAPRSRERLALHDRLIDLGVEPATIAHPSAVIAEDAVIGPGSQIMAGAIIGPAAKLGKCCYINANVGVDHDDVLEDGTEISPGATLCGMVTLGRNVWIGAGATILPGIHIGENAVVGAGAVVNRNVPENTTVVGIPAKPLIKK